MRTLLLQPPLSPASEVNPPVGLCTLAAWLQGQGHEVRILDLDLDVRKGDGSEHQQSVDMMLRQIADFEPGLLAVTSMYSNSLQAARLLATAKEQHPGLITVAGGPHFGALPAESMRRIPQLDAAVEGEGEQALSALITAVEQGTSWADIPSLHFRSNGELRANPQGPLLDLGTFGPIWQGLGEAVSLDRYAGTIPQGAPRKLMYVEAGRGCPYHCTFCATAPFWQRKFRVKPVDVLVEEIRFLHEHLGYDSFVLVHDLLTVSRKFISDFCDAMLQSQLPVEWMANSRTDIKLPGLLPKMKAAGCWKLFFGVESASDRMQEAFDKHLDQKEVFHTITELAEHGLASTCSFVIGFEHETPEEVSASIASGARLKLLGAEIVQFHRLRLWPPARLTKEGLPVEFDLDSLRIEYPFTQLPDDDVDAIRNDNVFFSGYFVPLSGAGNSTQLAQVEMFFHHVVAIAPLTLAALAQFLGEKLVPSFYAALDRLGTIQRQQLDWEGGGLWANWQALRPWLDALIASADDQAAEILCGLADYEEKRLRFTKSTWGEGDGAVAQGEGWVVFPCSVNAPKAIASLCAGQPLGPEVLEAILVVLVRRPGNNFQAYSLEPAMLSRLRTKDPELLKALADLAT